MQGENSRNGCAYLKCLFDYSVEKLLEDGLYEVYMKNFFFLEVLEKQDIAGQ